KFKGLEFKLEGKYILIYGIFNPKKLIAKLKIKHTGVSEADYTLFNKTHKGSLSVPKELVQMVEDCSLTMDYKRNGRWRT
uniref:hypothetical protein n=1 Tax=Ruminiclostridium cellobioparum TaxID=29355 RepID=UPI001A9A3D71